MTVGGQHHFDYVTEFSHEVCPYYTQRHNFILCILLHASVIWAKRDVFMISKKHNWVTFVTDKKKKHKTGFRMCLKQIPQPNNKDGDSCCFKSTAAQRHGSPWKRKGVLAFQQNWGRLQWSLWQNQITTWRRTHWTNSALLEARYRIFPVKHWRTYH